MKQLNSYKELKAEHKPEKPFKVKLTRRLAIDLLEKLNYANRTIDEYEAIYFAFCFLDNSFEIAEIPPIRIGPKNTLINGRRVLMGFLESGIEEYTVIMLFTNASDRLIDIRAKRPPSRTGI